MTGQYIEKRYIRLSEEQEPVDDDGETRVVWTASAQGPLTPSRIWVDVSRTAADAATALEALNVALEEQGWAVSAT